MNFNFKEYPLGVSLSQWKVLNKCYAQNNISPEEIIEAILAANKLALVDPIDKKEFSVMQVLIDKAEKILTFDDFKNIDKEKINEIQELKKLKNYILYPYQLARDFYKKKEIFNIQNINSGWYTSYGYFIPNEAKKPSNNRNALVEETILWSILAMTTYIQPWSFSFLIASLHSYIFKNSAQKWLSWYSHAQQFQQLQLSCFISNDKKYDLEDELNENTLKIELYIVEKNTQQKHLILDEKKYHNYLKLLSMDNKYISCSDFVYDIQKQSTINIEKNYMVVAYLAHDVYLMVKIDQSESNEASKNSTLKLLTLSNFMACGYKEKICEIGIGKKIDDKIELICSLKKYTENTGFPSDILLSTDCTKLFVYFLELQYYRQTNQYMVEIFSLPDPHNVSYEDLFSTDNVIIKKIKPLKGIFFYFALLLFLYKSGYFFLRDRIILEQYKQYCEIENWYELILKSMRSFKNKFLPPIKRFLRKEYIRVAKENRYSRKMISL